MATTGTSWSPYSGRPTFNLNLTVTRAGVSGNSSGYVWTLRAYNTTGSSQTYALDNFTWHVFIEDQHWTGAHSLDFRGGQAYIQLASGATNWYAHDANGYRQIDFEASHSTSSVFGTADTPLVSYQADRIPKAPSTPSAPTHNNGLRTSSSLNYTLNPPADNGGSPVLDYYMELSTNSGFTGIIQTRTSASSSQSFGSLSPNTSYWLRYRARNAIGNSAFSSGSQGTTLAAVPGAPTAFDVTPVSPDTVNTTWTAPSANGSAITHYRIQRATNSGFTTGVVEFTDPASPFILTGLTPSTTYYFRVAAVNGVGSGPWSTTETETTISGAYISIDNVWVPVGVLVSDGATWEVATISVSNGSAWIDAV